MSVAGTMAPRPWKWMLMALLALALLIPVWTVVVMTVIQPEALTTENQTMGARFWWWLAGPLVVVALFFGWRWTVASHAAKNVPGAAAGTAEPAAQPVAANDQAQREYVLEVLGLGVSYEKYRQGRLWNALAAGNPHTTLREQDPKKYSWARLDKAGDYGTRTADAFENAALQLPFYWGAPAFLARAEALQGHYSNASPGTVCADPGDQTFVAAGWETSARPDRLLERVFKFFDEHPDVPYVVVSACAGLADYDERRGEGVKPVLADGYYIPKMPDSGVVFVLARRERVDRIRPWAYADIDDEEEVLSPELNKYSPARKLYLAYLDATEKKGSVTAPRTLTVAEWLQETAAFGKREDIYPKGLDSALHTLHPKTVRLKGDFPRTPWFPIPWNHMQLRFFDRLPSLGFIHRPVYVKTTDDKGNPLSRSDARAAALAAGWQQALQTLPEAKRKTSPARVIVGTGGNTEQLVALHTMLNGWAEQGGPELDSNKPAQWINTDARLENTGAATWFMQMAIGVMGSYIEGGTSVAINLRDPREASLIFIEPPAPEKIKSQGDVLKHKATPTIDPANYRQ